MNAVTTREAEVTGFIRERLSGAFEIEKMILFGSQARAEAHAESDWDVLVITETDVPFAERQALAMRCLRRRDFAVDLLVYTPAEADRERQILGSALYWADREGRVMYAKS